METEGGSGSGTRKKTGGAAATVPDLPADDTASIIAENAAAAAAAREDLLKRTALAAGGSVQTDLILPPATERCKLIRINRELKNQPTILGNSDAESALYSLEKSTLSRMGVFTDLFWLKTWSPSV